MVDMIRTARVPSVGPQYNTFLYATIGVEPNGTSLSVLSAMARMNLDPWREAENLAGLSGKAASDRLAAMLASLPGGPPTGDESGVTAARLVRLLPQQGILNPPLSQQAHTPMAPFLVGITKALSAKSAIYVVVLLIVLTLGAQWFDRRSPPASPAQTPVSETTERPQVPLGH